MAEQPTETRGERIRRLRTSSGLTQRALANMLDTDRNLIARWESGRGDPNIENAHALAELLGVSLDYLATGRESAHRVEA